VSLPGEKNQRKVRFLQIQKKGADRHLRTE
jgi:hypothetical protein